ncbi:MAG: hypothetical protein IT426_11900 [Pirellulales bacterium]|nr:hypothetical protein [Pirellulales bacterium]
MSIGSLPAVVASAAGTPLAQSKAEVERTNVEVGAQQRQVFNALKAESAAGIGETDGQDHEAAERDADGRRLWEAPTGGKKNPPVENPPSTAPQSRDATGQAGNLLDLSG